MRATIQPTSLTSRAPAALTAGVLALSAVMPPVAFAEQDQTDDGTAAVTQNTATDPDQSASFDPGGDAAGLPDAAPTTATSSPTPPAAPDASDQADPVVDPGDGADAETATPPAASSATAAPTPPAAPQQPSVEALTPAAPTAESDAGPVAAVPPGAPAPQAPVVSTVTARRVKSVHRLTRRHRLTASNPAQIPTVAAPVPVVVTPRAVPGNATSIPAKLRAKPGDRTHTVRRGESLWVIATDLLGPRATVTAVAREVHLLWVHNSARIGTGDPDMLLIGTKLILR